MSYKDDPDYKAWIKLSLEQKREQLRRHGLGGSLNPGEAGYEKGLVGDFTPEPVTTGKE